MIKRVRRKFIAITMTMLTTVLLVPLVALNLLTEMITYNQAADLLEQIAISEASSYEKENKSEPQPPHQNDSNNPDEPGDPDEPPEEKEETTGTQTAPEKKELSTTVTKIVEKTAEPAHEPEQANAPADVPETQTEPEMDTDAEADTAPEQTDVVDSPVATQQQTKPAASTHAPEETKAAATARVTAPVTQDVQTDAPPQTQPTKPTARETEVRQTKPTQTVTKEKNPEWKQEDAPGWMNQEDQGEQIAAQGTAVAVALSAQAQTQTAAVTTAQTETTTATTTRQKPDSVPDKPSSDSDTATIDHFLCILDADGVLVELDGTEDYTETEAQTLSDAVMAEDATDGYYGNLQYYRKNIKEGTILVFADRSAERLLLRNILWISIFMFFFMEGIVLVLTMVLTKRAMRPMYDTFERQRQFISDAGHELKTPLTIISANADILQDEIGENKWLSYIQSQTERMRVLIADMMNLTKLETSDPQRDFQQFSLSAAVSSAALPFESQAFEQHKHLNLEIQENISYTGNSDQIKQLVGIFIDNAIKYSDENAEIRVTLSQTRDKKTLKFYNTGKGVKPEEREKIFQRFYRSDSSRTRMTGGYGLGLSIAQSIADTHKIKIQVESEYEKWICFTLTL